MADEVRATAKSGHGISGGFLKSIVDADEGGPLKDYPFAGMQCFQGGSLLAIGAQFDS